MGDRYSWYGGTGSWNHTPSKLEQDLRSVAVATGPLPMTGGCHSGSYMTWCGNVRKDAYLGTFSEADAKRYSQFSWPYLRYKLQGGENFVSDAAKARNFIQSPDPCSALDDVYSFSGDNEMATYSQERSHATVKKAYMPREYVYAKPNEELSMTEAQMMQPPIDHSYGFHPIPVQNLGMGGGSYTVNRLTRQVEKKPYFMGPSQGYPTAADAQWAADNLVTPRSMLASKTL
jgi:hypothetical protein